MEYRPSVEEMHDWLYDQLFYGYSETQLDCEQEQSSEDLQRSTNFGEHSAGKGIIFPRTLSQT